MNIRKIIIIGLATMSLTGCKSLYGTYERPEVKMNGIVRDPVNDEATLEGTNNFWPATMAQYVYRHISAGNYRKDFG